MPLTSEQVSRIIENTVTVVRERPELIAQWRADLLELLAQARRARLEDESIFVAAVIALLESPRDTLPTGTIYDTVWQTILAGLRTGDLPSSLGATRDEALERLLRSVAEAVVVVMTRAPDQKGAVADELRELRQAAAESRVDELAGWLDDALALLAGTPLETLGRAHQGIYAAYWGAIAEYLAARA